MLTFALAAVLNTAAPVLSWLSPVTLSDSSSSTRNLAAVCCQGGEIKCRYLRILVVDAGLHRHLGGGHHALPALLRDGCLLGQLEVRGLRPHVDVVLDQSEVRTGSALHQSQLTLSTHSGLLMTPSHLTRTWMGSVLDTWLTVGCWNSHQINLVFY